MKSPATGHGTMDHDELPVRNWRVSRLTRLPRGVLPEAAATGGLIGQLLCAGQVLAMVEAVEDAEHRAQVRVGPAHGRVDQAKLALLAVAQSHRVLLQLRPAVGGLGAGTASTAPAKVLDQHQRRLGDQASPHLNELAAGRRDHAKRVMFVHPVRSDS